MSGKPLRSLLGGSLLVPLVQAAAATRYSVGLDRLGFDWAKIDFLIGAIGGAGATIAVTLQHSDDNSTFADLTAAILGGSVEPTLAITDADAGSLQNLVVNLSLAKRYIRLKVVVAVDTYANAAVINLGAAQVEPTTAPTKIVGAV